MAMRSNRILSGTCGIVLMLVSTSRTKADVIAYMLGGGDERFGTIDLTTGAYTNIGGTSGVQLSGLGLYNGALYGEANLGSTLYRVNPSTGALTAIATSGATPGGAGYEVTGSTTTGLFAGVSSEFDR